jgi:hypothetical protein
MNELEKTFSPVLFGPFLSVVAALCFTAYTAITVSNIVQHVGIEAP